MTIRTAEELVDAHRQVQVAETSQEKDAAAERLVTAELAHFKKLGLEREPQGIMQRVILPVAVILVVAVTAVLVVKFSAEASGTAHTVAEIQTANIVSQRETCERQNDSREASVEEKRKDIYLTLKPTLHLWTAVVKSSGIDPNTPAPVVAAFNDYLSKLRRGIHSKKVGIHKALAAIKDVAEEPGSPRANCAEVVPLP